MKVCGCGCGQTVPTFDELFPNGREVWYEGTDPEGFRAWVRQQFGLELELRQDVSGYRFFCPAGYVEAIYNNKAGWPMGS